MFPPTACKASVFSGTVFTPLVGVAFTFPLTVLVRYRSVKESNLAFGGGPRSFFPFETKENFFPKKKNGLGVSPPPPPT